MKIATIIMILANHLCVLHLKRALKRDLSLDQRQIIFTIPLTATKKNLSGTYKIKICMRQAKLALVYIKLSLIMKKMTIISVRKEILIFIILAKIIFITV